MGSYWHRKIICPFYIWDEKDRIGCEGKFKIAFDSNNDIKRYMDRYCSSWAWEACPHAQLVKKKYEEEKDGNHNKRIKRKNK